MGRTCSLGQALKTGVPLDFLRNSGYGSGWDGGGGSGVCVCVWVGGGGGGWGKVVQSIETQG